MLGTRHINIMRYQAVVLLFIFVFYGINRINHINYISNASSLSGISHKASSDNILQQQVNAQEFLNFQYSCGTALIGFFNDTKIKEIFFDTDNKQLLKLFTIKSKPVIKSDDFLPDLFSSHQPQFIQSVTLPLLNRNIRI